MWEPFSFKLPCKSVVNENSNTEKLNAVRNFIQTSAGEENSQ